MTTGKSISLFLIDGSPDGVVACELFNWTGKGFRIPRNSLKSVCDRQDLRKAGVYFLFGRDDSDREAVYIGEAEEVMKRLLQHQDKDFWSEALVFISKDENLNKAHVKYLEYALHDQAIRTKRYSVINTNTPSCPAISEAEQAVMTEFAANLCLLVGTMGYKVFEKLTKTAVAKHDKFYISAARGARAEGVVTSEGFVVLKGSKCASSEVPSMPIAFANKRSQLLAEKTVENWEFTQDYLFQSPSTAAAIVMGRSANGLIEWKKADGSTLRDNQAKSE
jgi:hypothetical protein